MSSFDSNESEKRRLEEEKKEESFDTYETWLSHIWSTEDLFEKYRKNEEEKIPKKLLSAKSGMTLLSLHDNSSRDLKAKIKLAK